MNTIYLYLNLNFRPFEIFSLCCSFTRPSPKPNSEGKIRLIPHPWENCIFECLLPDAPTPSDLTRLAQQIKVWFETLETLASEHGFGGRAAFQDLFSDLRYLPSENIGEKLKADPGSIIECLDQLKVEKKQSQGQKEELFLENNKNYLRLLICKGLYLYLKTDDRFRKFDARLIYLYCCWQWYHIIRFLLDKNNQKRESLKWINEMATAFQELSQVKELDDLRVHGTMDWLINASQAVMPKTSDISDRVRLQMLMESSQKDSGRFPTFAPLGLFESKISWDKCWLDGSYDISLHPVFLSPSPRKAVVRAQAEIALNNYDFETALRVANLLTGRRINLHGKPLWLTLVLLVVLVLGGLTIVSFFLSNSLGGYARLINIFGPVLIFALLRNFFDHRLLYRLFLPRLVGGIFIGFSVLVVQSDPIRISNAIWRGGGFLVASLWVAVLVIGIAYLYGDIRPRIRDKAEVLNRTWQSISVFTLFTLVIGLLTLTFPTAAFFDYLISPVLILGPIGWVDLKLWLCYSPLALFLGIVTQFLFEDKTITASVWPVEKD